MSRDAKDTLNLQTEIICQQFKKKTSFARTN